MLTPDLIQKMNQAVGGNVSLNPNTTGVPSRADEIRQLAQASSKTQAVEDAKSPMQKDMESMGPIGKFISKLGSNYANEVAGGVKGISDSVKTGISNADNINPNQNPIAGGIKLAGAAGKAGLGAVPSALRTIFAPLTAINKTALPSEGLGGSVAQGAATGSELGGPVGSLIGGAAGAGMYGLEKVKQLPGIQKLFKDHPGSEQAIDGAIALTLTAIGSKRPEADILNKPAMEGLQQIGSNVANTVKAPVSFAIDKAQAAYKKGTHLLEDRSVNKLQENYDKILTRTKTLSKDYDPETSKFLAEKARGRPDMIPGVNENGNRFDTTKQQGLLREDLIPLNETMNQMLDQIPEKGSLSDLGSKTKSAISQLDSVSAQTKNSMKAAIDKTINAEIAANGGEDLASASQINKIKIQQINESGVFDSTKPKFSSDANYQMGKAARTMIGDISGDAPVHELNKYIGQHYDALDALERLNGQVAKGGQLGKYVAMGLGASMGSTIPGKIGGAIVGNYIVDAMMSNSLSNPVLNAILEQAKTTNPDVYENALRYVKNAGLEQEVRLRLGPGAIQTPAPKQDTGSDIQVVQGKNGEAPPANLAEAKAMNEGAMQGKDTTVPKIQVKGEVSEGLKPIEQAVNDSTITQMKVYGLDKNSSLSVKMSDQMIDDVARKLARPGEYDMPHVADLLDYSLKGQKFTTVSTLRQAILAIIKDEDKLTPELATIPAGPKAKPTPSKLPVIK